MGRSSVSIAGRTLSAALAALLSVQVLAVPMVAAQSTKVSVPVGTVVDLTFENLVDPKTAPIGSTVNLKVSSPVVIQGKTVIPAGAMALAEVTQSSKAGAIGKPASIAVTVKHVTAADGTVVPLTGTRAVEGESHQTSAIVITVLCCILGLLQKGGSAEIPAGSGLRATVAAPVEVGVSD